MKEIIDINEPTIADVIIRKDEVDVCFTTSNGQHETKLHLQDDDSAMLTVNYGDISGIGFGGTDNWGKDCLPLYVDFQAGSVNYDGVMVDDITIQELSSWCRCELINSGTAVKYTALSENPTPDPRIAYFIHSTTDTTVKKGYNEGRPAASSWYVTVIQKGNPDVQPEPEPVPEPKDLGEHQFDIGILSDLHTCKANDNNSPETTDDWWDEDDFRTTMDIYVADPNIKAVMSCGDVAESQTNDYKKHPESTCDADYAEFTQMYDVPYWQVAGLRFFSPLGNHDFYGIFESRSGDTITGKKNTETIIGYNAGVQSRLGLWVTGQQINGIVPGRGRIVFDLENGKSTPQGQADMRFFSFNDYVDLYCRQGGYTGSSIWDSNKGGISDEAIKCAKQYVNNNWSSVRDNLVMWNDGGSHGRNGYSKLSYWLKKDGNIFIFLSVDYGNDIWGVKDGWHDRMIHARTILNLEDTSDPYIRRMKEFVSDTGYSSADEKYNYQYYSPNALIWLKEILENNQDSKIFIFSHHYLPNKVGNSTGIPKDGNWSYADIQEDGVKTSEGINKGSNCLTGIQFWFINKLNNLYKNAVWFSGHSHISYESGNHIDNHDYRIVSPAEGGQFVYTKADNTPIGDAAYSVALPSLSKPRYVAGATSERLYQDAEMTIMEIYENGVVLKGYKVRKDNKNVYDKNSPLFRETLMLR